MRQRTKLRSFGRRLPGGCLVLGAIFLAAGQAAAQERDLGREVLAVFEAACVECHAPGSDSPKAQRFWADARDLPALVTEALIDTEDPEASILWEEVEEGRMPPEEHEPLTADQKAVILAWIQAGAPAPRPAPVETNPPRGAGDDPTPPTGEPEPPTGQPAKAKEPLSFIGKLHPLTVHFPIAFLLGAALAELAVLFGVHAAGARVSGRFLVTIAALSTPVTAFCGWQAGEASTTRYEDVLFLHRWLGVATLVTCVILWISSEARARGKSGLLAKAYRVLLLLATILVCAGGHQGGILTHGPGFLPLPWE